MTPERRFVGSVFLGHTKKMTDRLVAACQSLVYQLFVLVI